MTGRRVGIWLVGALGSISTTVITGALALRKGLIAPIGMLTATEPFEGLDLAPIAQLEFGGCDVRAGSLAEAARHLIRETRAIDHDILTAVESDLGEVDCSIRVGTTRNCGEAIERLTALGRSARECTLREEIATIRSALQQFRSEKALDALVVVNLASTEPPLKALACHEDLGAFEEVLDRNEPEAVRASTLYAYAAIREHAAYVNFTPSTGALIPALLRLATQQGVPVMGNDGKTGETLVKSVLAPMFVARNLEVLSWEGFNILGNMDGCILDHPDNRESKLKTKDQVLGKILGYTPHSKVHIDYVPSLDDQKTAWDFIHFRGFLGAKMSLQFIWQGFDSLLAAPLVLDLARLADLALQRGEGGLMPQLASYFKAPIGVSEHRLMPQVQMLLDYVDHAKASPLRPRAAVAVS